jgi:hypothetical protein
MCAFAAGYWSANLSHVLSTTEFGEELFARLICTTKWLMVT